MHIGFWNQNVEEEKQVCIWVLLLEAKRGISKEH
jgi:hypothetical protein